MPGTEQFAIAGMGRMSVGVALFAAGSRLVHANRAFRAKNCVIATEVGET